MSVKVHRIEVYNFKSYSGHVSLGPFQDFTCIVGPNGSGKSNVMDALSFVLGSSAASLRGKDTSDFICRTAAKKECSVSLILRYATGEETKLTRALDSKGSIKLSVDKLNVTEKEFGAVLKKHRLGSRISSFLVFQHEVDAVAHKKAHELTELLEQISGSAELKEEYVQRRKTLDAVNEELAAASLEKRGALAEVNQMRLHKKEAERFAEISDKINVQRRDLAMVELFFVEHNLTKQKQELARLQEAVKAMQKEIASEDEIRGMKKQYADKHKSYMEHLKENRTLNFELREKKTNLDRLAISLEHLRKKHEAYQADLKVVKASTSVRSKETERLQEQLKQQEALLKAFEEQCAKEDAQSSGHGSMTATQMTEYRKLRKEADCETISKRQELESMLRQRESIHEGLKHAAAALDSHENQTKEIQQTIDRTQERITELERKSVEVLAAQREAKEKEAQTVSRLSTMQHKAKEVAEELAKVQQQLHELRYVKDDNKTSQRLAEALQSLKSLYPNGIRGRLVDLCDIPNPKYRSAVTVAFGKNLEAIVVDTTETAMACVRYLKEQRLVSMTFLPLSSVTGKPVDDSFRTFGGTTKPMVDVIKFDPAIEAAIRYAIGQTLVCDSTDEARRVAYGQNDGTRHKVVTVDGTVLLKNGSIQGGLAAVQSRARKWDEKRYDDLKAARDRLLKDQGSDSEADAAKLRVELKDIQSRAEFQGKRNEAIQSEIKTLHAKVANLKKEAEKQSASSADIRKRSVQYTKALTECDAKVEVHRHAIRDVEDRIFKEFQKKVNIPNIAEVEQREARQAKQRAEKRQQFQLVIQKLRTSIDSEMTRVGVRKETDVASELQKIAKEMSVCQNDFKVYGDITNKLEKKQEALQTSITQSKAELDHLEDSIRRSTKNSEEEVRRLAIGRKQVNTVQAACEALRLQRLSLFQRCRMEETELPVVDAEAAGNKRQRTSDVSVTKKRGGATVDSEEFFMNISEAFTTYSDTEATRAKGAKEVQVCIDFSSLPSGMRQHAKDTAAFSSFKHKSEVALEQLERELESIAPNLKATTRFGNTESKLGTTSAQLDEVREKARKALTAFLRIKEQRVQRFMETFDKIAENVDRVYRELTLGTRAHDVHGSAYLTIDDAEEPYNGGIKYHATPPMKRFMTMELLSGGERTMAALALLFAINAVSPTPFFVLDEVDAALDIGNVIKLGNYLRSHCHSCQFIVVSLKEQLYHLADGLVGIYKDRSNESSGTLTLDLRSTPN